MKINQLAFIRDLIIKVAFTNCNTTVILIKTGLAINIPNMNDYKETKLYKY